MMMIIENFAGYSAKNRLPEGYYTVRNNFKITPDGGWAISITIGSLLHVTADEKLLLWNPHTKVWRNRKPPIQGRNDLVISDYSGASSMLSTFVSSTKLITKAEANVIMSATPTTKMTARDAINLLRKVSKDTIVNLDMHIRESVGTNTHGMLTKDDLEDSQDIATIYHV